MTSRGAGSPWLAAEVLDMPSLSQPTSIGFVSPLSLSLLYAGSAAKEAVPDRATGQGQGSRLRISTIQKSEREQQVPPGARFLEMRF